MIATATILCQENEPYNNIYLPIFFDSNRRILLLRTVIISIHTGRTHVMSIFVYCDRGVHAVRRMVSAAWRCLDLFRLHIAIHLWGYSICHCAYLRAGRRFALHWRCGVGVPRRFVNSFVELFKRGEGIQVCEKLFIIESSVCHLWKDFM